MPHRLLATICLALALVPGCYAGFIIAPSSDPSMQDDSNHDLRTGVLVGLTAAAILAIAVIATRHGDHADPPAAQVMDPPPPPMAGPRAGEASDETAARVERLVAQAHVAVHAGRCDSVQAVARELWTFAPASAYQAFVAEPEIAACVQ
jgi:hypothetical protein